MYQRIVYQYKITPICISYESICRYDRIAPVQLRCRHALHERLWRHQKKRSSIWEFFIVGEDTHLAKCNACRELVSRGGKLRGHIILWAWFITWRPSMSINFGTTRHFRRLPRNTIYQRKKDSAFFEATYTCRVKLSYQLSVSGNLCNLMSIKFCISATLQGTFSTYRKQHWDLVTDHMGPNVWLRFKQIEQQV